MGRATWAAVVVMAALAAGCTEARRERPGRPVVTRREAVDSPAAEDARLARALRESFEAPAPAKRRPDAARRATPPVKKKAHAKGPAMTKRPHHAPAGRRLAATGLGATAPAPAQATPATFEAPVVRAVAPAARATAPVVKREPAPPPPPPPARVTAPSPALDLDLTGFGFRLLRASLGALWDALEDVAMALASLVLAAGALLVPFLLRLRHR